MSQVLTSSKLSKQHSFCHYTRVLQVVDFTALKNSSKSRGGGGGGMGHLFSSIDCMGMCHHRPIWPGKGYTFYSRSLEKGTDS